MTTMFAQEAHRNRRESQSSTIRFRRRLPCPPPGSVIPRALNRLEEPREPGGIAGLDDMGFAQTARTLVAPVAAHCSEAELALHETAPTCATSQGVRV